MSCHFFSNKAGLRNVGARNGVESVLDVQTSSGQWLIISGTFEWLELDSLLDMLFAPSWRALGCAFWDS